jgi:hypothetical protein
MTSLVEKGEGLAETEEGGDGDADLYIDIGIALEERADRQSSAIHKKCVSI